jgi:deoxyribodipyrimidine photo-lyase
MRPVPDVRVETLNDGGVRADGRYVLYWMVANRRTTWNFALQRAAGWAKKLGRPLVVFEPLRAGYRWACDRFHLFALEGMRDNRARCEAAGVAYYPYVEPVPDADKGLLAAFAQEACVVVTDDYPSFFLPHMVRAAAAKVDVRLEQVDANGLLPLRATERVFPTAFSFRAFLQKHLVDHLAQLPLADPLRNLNIPALEQWPAGLEKRWPRASEALLAGDPAALKKLPIDHAVGRGAVRGGSVAAGERLAAFVEERLPRYEERSDPDADAASGLSPYLHWGHLSAHEVFAAVARREDWELDRVGKKGTGGKKEGWWGMSPEAEAFLDELVTWRELGFNMKSKREDADRYEALPDWARATLEKHAKDRRGRIYSLEELEEARTGDPLWNAAQRQLVREGRLHNYLRMLWGKKILEWTRSPREALEVLFHLNDKYALDGRDPNSTSGIMWTLGRYDRPWGPERPVFGTIRYMSSENTARKLEVKKYLARFGAEPELFT